MKVLKGKSGVTVLFRHMKTGLVDFRYLVSCGAIDEDPEDAGYCHALEHMLFAGTKRRTWLKINRDWEKLGAWYNAETWHDRTFYFTTCLRKGAEEAYEVLADMFYNSTFPEERWEDVEKGAILSEIQGDEDDEGTVLEERLFGDALGIRYHPIIGSQENIKKATVQDLTKFYNRYYRGKNVFLLVTGDLDEGQVLKMVNKYDKLRCKRPPLRRKLDFPFRYSAVNIDKPGMEQALVQGLKPVYVPRTLRTKVALDIGVECLAQYLFEELREKRGLCYRAKADIYEDLPGNYFLRIRTATDEVRLGTMRQALRQALSRFTEDGLTNERIENTLVKEIYQTVEASELVESSAGWMWDAWGEQVYADPFQTHLGIVEALNVSSVRRVLRKALQGRFKFGEMS